LQNSIKARMKGCMFNIDNGYLEGLCRGFKNGILRQADYLNLVQCETLEDLKLHLQVHCHLSSYCTVLLYLHGIHGDWCRGPQVEVL
jgi:hypothetical protein